MHICVLRGGFLVHFGLGEAIFIHAVPFVSKYKAKLEVALNNYGTTIRIHLPQYHSFH